MRLYPSSAAAAFALLLAGCFAPSPVAPPEDVVVPDLGEVVIANITNVLHFKESIVKAAAGYAADLYEPTLEVSDTGTIYIAGHVIGVDTTGTPAYFSRDDGATWQPLPFAAIAYTPPPGQGAAPPPGDEGFILAGDKGQAWMVDITGLTFPVTGWCDNGGSECYHNPNAYDRQTSTTTCNPGSLNDRPWGAYANGKLLMVNNPGGGPVQVGVMDVPPALPGEVMGAKWNMCASDGGWIPGVPGLRKDGFFAVPQGRNQGANEPQMMHVVVGNVADLNKVEQIDVFEFEHAGGGGANFGHATFDANGVLYVAAMNNSVKNNKLDKGQFIVSTSLDNGGTFHERTFQVTAPIKFFFVDGNPWGPGALVSWSVVGKGAGVDDWYVGHLQVNATGAPSLSNVSFVGKSTGAYGHVIGSAVGPDGRAYVATFHTEGTYQLSNPLRVWVQDKGTPGLPIVKVG